MIDKPILINFNAPSSTKQRFDKVCRLADRTRTSVLVELMNDYIMTKTRQIADWNDRIRIADIAINEASHADGGEPLAFFGSDDDDDDW